MTFKQALVTGLGIGTGIAILAFVAQLAASVVGLLVVALF